jgi:lipoprotein-anchoring transpeptidase ErfK/SrfK
MASSNTAPSVATAGVPVAATSVKPELVAVAPPSSGTALRLSDEKAQDARTLDPAKAEPAKAEPAKSGAATAEPSEAAKPAPPAITLAIDIDLTRQAMTIKEHGKVVGSWPISSGREGYRTPTGTFRPLWQSRMWYSRKYDNAPMPHAVFFNGGVAMHATQATGMLGRPASHGCIRQSPANAAKTYALVSKHGNSHTRIVVRGQPRDAEPAIARRSRGGEGVQVAARGVGQRVVFAGQPSMRRVIFIDGDGNRRLGLVPANDPRLAPFQAREYRSAPVRRAYYGGPSYW